MLNLDAMKICQLICFSLLMLMGIASKAAVVPNLYNAQIPVASQNSSDRPAAIKEAYQSVLIKVTGNGKVMQNARIRTNAAQAETYIQQYSYQTNTDANNATYPYQLLVQFDPEAINRSLLAAKLPIWGQDRPLTIFWIATTVNAEQRLLSASDESPILIALDKSAQIYGLPILFPILDLNDLNQLSVTDVTGRFVAPVVQASVRYGSNAVVMINIEQQNNQWTSLWTLVTANAPQSWSVQDADLNNMIAQGMNKLVSMLSQQFALSAASQHTIVKIQINGIANLSDYARVTRYLKRIAVVKKVTLLALARQQATFQLGLASNSASLQKSIALDPTLTPVKQPEVQPVAALLNSPGVNSPGDVPAPLSTPTTPTPSSTTVQNNFTETLVYQWTP
ncbi:MAG: DUF2066 domain-containing protein [Gammaproteobacteria bacterium]|nr:DUF2066 domain-containing protein [Gammaproteobacteria bacterium]